MAEQYKTRGERRQQVASRKKTQKKPKKPKNLLKRIFLTLVTIGIICLIFGVGTFAYYVSDAPKLDEKLLKDPVASTIYDKNKNVLAEVGKENRDYVNYEDIPKLVEDAFLATEDSRFYQHHGVDFLRLGSAVMANITGGFGAQGGSTITQQVVKRSYLSPDKTINGKYKRCGLPFNLNVNIQKKKF